ncbi:hypothetical protein JVX93_16065 [Mycolicibacterium boenickei]|nr:hypothetical protein JVX93_16065 [Mycolicibacterium boenickei]
MTTPVGSIRFDLKIDGSSLPADVLESIYKSIAPALADLQRRLSVLERDYGDVGRAAEKSGAKQAAAASVVAEAVEHIGDEHTKTARKAVAAGQLTTRQINAQTKAFERQTAAILANTAARVSNAGAPTGGGPPRGGGGGGGGSGGRRGGSGAFGDLFTGQGGGGRFLTSPVGLNAIALGVGSFPAAATAVTNLTGAIQQLIQAGGVLPGVIAGGVTSVGTAALGFKGMADAVTALNEAAASGDPKDLEKVAEALKDMDPAAVAVAKSVSRLTQGPLKDLQKQTAGKMFAGVDAEIDQLANKTMPTLMRGTAEVGSAWNKTFKEIGRVGGLDSTQSFLDKIFGNTADAQNRANAAIDPLIHGIGTLTSESSDFLPRLADGLTAGLTRLDNWLTKSADNGNLGKWINQGIDAAGHMGETLLNVGKIITSITKAAGGDGGLLEALEDGSTALSNFLASDEGQEKLTTFFREGREQLDKWWPILKNIGSIAGDVYNGMKQWSEVLLPVLTTITGVLANMPGGIAGVVTAFLAWRTITGVTSLLGQLTSLGGILDKLPGRARNAASGVRGGLSGLKGIGATLGLGVALDGLNREPGDKSVGTGLKTVGGAALTGASVGGLPGLAVGAGVGIGLDIYQRDKLRQQQIDEFNKKLREAGGDNQKMRELNNAFFGENIYDPGKLGDLLKPGTFARQGIIDEANKGTFSQYGVDGSNIEATLEKVVSNAKLAKQSIDQLGDAVTTIPSGEIVLKDPTPQLIDRVRALGLEVKTLPNGQVAIDVNTDVADNKMKAFIAQWSSTIISPTVAPNTPGATSVPTIGGIPFPGRPGSADGGVLPGYSPGVDNMLWPMSGGEGVVIPEAMRALGSGWLYDLNSRFRAGISRRGYADGGVVGAGGVLPEDNTVLGLLGQIRDLLAGKGGTSAPLNQTADAVANLAGASGRGGQQMGPFGTPLKKRGDPGYEMAAAAIQALGGDPEKWIGADPSTYIPAGVGGGGLTSGGVANYGSYATALAAFARTGMLDGDLTSLGLDANDPVVKAIATARNKKKGGLGGDAIAGLVGQVLTGGGYTGTLDSSNTSLIGALQTFREKLAKRGGGSTIGTAAVAGATGVPLTALPAGVMDPISAYAQRASGGQYSWGASDLASGLSDCSGAVSDLVELITEGQATSKRLFSTSDAGTVLKSLGAVSGAVPGALQIGWSDSHMRATLPNGVNFESGGQTGQGATYGGNAQGAAGLPNIMSLPANGVPLSAGMAGVGAAGGGTPVFVTNWPGQGAGLPGVGGILGAGLQAGGQAAGNVTGDVMSAVSGLGQEPWNKATNYATLNSLVRERNPLALAKAFGLDVPDFTRQGGDGADVMKNDQAFDSSGRLFSDTGALLDRTFTNLNAQLQAMREQLVSVIEQTNQKLNEEALEPVVKAGVQNALEGLKDSVTGAIGTAMGQAAAPPIADAVRAAIPAQTNGGSLAGDAVNGVKAATGMATGGAVWGGIAGKDSVPLVGMPGEHMLTVDDVQAMGGQGNVYAFRRALHRSGGLRGYATGGGVNVNDTVGAEFFGVSQIPIIGAIVNILVRVLLSVLGVQIEARDTLGEMTDQFRQFRGEFKAFDASGRLLNDTSALMDRSQSSEEIAAQERIRILKIVIEALIKYIIEKVIVPITKAVANAAIQAGASAAGAAVNSQAPGAGGIVSSLISSAGSAGVDIAAEVGTDLALAISSVAIDAIAEGLQSIFPDMVGGIFGGGIIEQLIAAPITAALEIPLAIIGALTGGLTSLFAPLLAIIGGGTFDSGGVAHGVGLMPKATIRPERVLSPQQTASFDRLVEWLDRNQGSGGPGSQTIVQVGEGAIQVAGGPEAGRNVANGLMELMS